MKKVLTMDMLFGIIAFVSELTQIFGEMSEWLKEPVLKTGDGLRRPWVRIPLSPPILI